MHSNRRPDTSSVRRIAVLATTVLLGVLALPSTIQAQTGQFQVFPSCVLPPTPRETDTWPDAVTDSLGTITGASITFSGAGLLANDRGTALTLVSVGPTSSGGGTVTGTDPFTFTVASGFTGTDIFPYEISDAAGQTAIGLVKVTAAGDTIFPSVSITAPLAGATVSGSVIVQASASDNVGVTSVRFFDGATQIGLEDTAFPFETTWDTTLLANEERSLTAVARDAAGNTTTSPIVRVTVSNVAPDPGAIPTVQATVFSDGAGARTTPPFSTTTPGEVLVAFAASDGPPAADAQTLAISGAGLTWTRVQRAAAQFGVSEIWTATAPTVLTNVTVTSTQAAGGFYQSLTVIAFTGVGGVGASNVGSGVSVAPTVSLITQAAGSVVYAVGNDWDRAVARTIPAGQTKVHEFLAPVGDTFWVQAANGTIAAAGTSVTLNATGPINDQWNFAIVELTSGGAAPPPPPPPPPPPTPAGPVLALSFNEAGGAAANDSSGHGNNGTIAGAARVAGQAGFGSALSFDGVASIVNVEHSASLALTTGMTLEAWVNPSANTGVAPNAGWRTVILKERGADGLAYALYGNDGDMNPSRPAGYVHNGAGVGIDVEATAEPELPIGAWSHVAVTFDNDSIRLYVNGVLRGELAAPGEIAASTSPLRIGGNNVFSVPGTEFFAGLIDEVRVYNRALSAAEIATDMNTPLP